MSNSYHLTDAVSSFMKNNRLTPIMEFANVSMGWEGDVYGWVCKENGKENKKKIYVLTSHGSPYISDDKEIKRIKSDYCSWLEQINNAMFLVV